ncbi:glutamine dumper [Musa troglodytarum]|uniref:Glutamine dumper n=1 Tax=Musa troglodytarum TaxID=320322 RepID=A0A9E7L3G0_9LILI|nr:glutamine dumper [Musa troglodytarum]
MALSGRLPLRRAGGDAGPRRLRPPHPRLLLLEALRLPRHRRRRRRRGGVLGRRRKASAPVPLRQERRRRHGRRLQAHLPCHARR